WRISGGNEPTAGASILEINACFLVRQVHSRCRSKSHHLCWERPETMKEKRPVKIVQTLKRLRLLRRLLHPWLQSIWCSR
ncbi:unnamed protein product, partial [Brassica oleracea]